MAGDARSCVRYGFQDRPALRGGLFACLPEVLPDQLLVVVVVEADVAGDGDGLIGRGYLLADAARPPLDAQVPGDVVQRHHQLPVPVSAKQLHVSTPP